MNVLIHSRHLDIDADLRAAAEAAAHAALDVLDAPEGTPVTVVLNHGGHAGRWRAEATVAWTGPPVQASSYGPGAAQALAGLRGALVHEARLALRAPGRAAAHLAPDGLPIRRPGSAPAPDPNRTAKHRPPGYR